MSLPIYTIGLYRLNEEVYRKIDFIRLGFFFFEKRLVILLNIIW